MRTAARRPLAALVLAVAAVALAGCTATGPAVPSVAPSTTVSAPTASATASADSPAATPAPSPDPTPTLTAGPVLGLLDVWHVTDAAGEGTGTWIRFDGTTVRVFRPHVTADFSWSVQGEQMLATLTSWTPRTDADPSTQPKVAWLTTSTRFAKDGDGWRLIDLTGHTTAVLVREGSPPAQPHLAPDLVNPPVIDDAVRQQVADAVAAPTAALNLDPAYLVGRWNAIDPGGKTTPFLELSAHHWSGSDGCNGGAGQWRQLPDGMLLTTSSSSSLIGCTGVPVPTWFSKTRSVSVDGDRLSLFGRDGNLLGVLERPVLGGG